MIRVHDLIAWSAPSALARGELRAVPFAHLSVQSLERAAAFYRRVFDLHPAGGHDAAAGTAISLTVESGARFVLHERASPAVEMLPTCRRFGLVVGDLEQAREAVWELGVAIARDSGDADHVYRRPDGRSLYVRDPDDHELELVDVATTLLRARIASSRRRPPEAAPLAGGLGI